MKAFASVLAAFALQGCAVVVVQVADQRPRLSAWPLGVRVEPGADEAVRVNSASVGLVAGCGLAGVGAQRCEEIRIPVRGCGVAVIEQPDRKSRALLARIAGQARAHCLNETLSEETSK